MFLDSSLDNRTLCIYIMTRFYIQLGCCFTESCGLLYMIMHTELHTRGSAGQISAGTDNRMQSICSTEWVRCTGMLECLTLLYCIHYYRPVVSVRLSVRPSVHYYCSSPWDNWRCTRTVLPAPILPYTDQHQVGRCSLLQLLYLINTTFRQLVPIPSSSVCVCVCQHTDRRGLVVYMRVRKTVAKSDCSLCHVWLSRCQHGAESLSQDGFSWNFIRVIFFPPKNLSIFSDSFLNRTK